MRSLDAPTTAAITSSSVFPIWLARLDISNDPVYIHTGIGNIAFSAGQTGDAGLDGYTFAGIGDIGSISAIQDDATGSQSVVLGLPGVQLTGDYLNQLVFNQYTWQGNRAWLWFAAGNNAGAIIGNPTRVKTGRMDQMPITIDADTNTGKIMLTIESQQSYSNVPLYTRYSEQIEIDPLDMSQIYIPDLANKSPVIGDSTSDAVYSITNQKGSTAIIDGQIKALQSYNG